MYIGLYKTPNKALSCLVLSMEYRGMTKVPTSRDLYLKSGDSLFCTTHYPPPPNVNAPHRPLIRTLYEVLHEVLIIKIRFHHSNGKVIFLRVTNVPETVQ